MTEDNRQHSSARSRPLKALVRDVVDGIRQLLYKKPFRISLPPVSARPPGAWKTTRRKLSEAVDRPPAGTRGSVDSEERRTFYRLIAQTATGLWRVRRRTLPEGAVERPDEMRQVRRHVEATWDILTQGMVEIRDHIGEKYVTGMALKVVAFQPTPGVQRETIVETIRPSIFYKDTLIQRGQVIVATPLSRPAEAGTDGGAHRNPAPAPPDEQRDRAASRANEKPAHEGKGDLKGS